MLPIGERAGLSSEIASTIEVFTTGGEQGFVVDLEIVPARMDWNRPCPDAGRRIGR
jgi:hypothetical protein